MSPVERHELAELNARLFGLDGSSGSGAIGRIEDRLTSLEKQFNRVAGALALGAFVLGWLAPTLFNLVTSAVHP